ncbi:hypothetical protein DN412_21580 [Cupriavidus lacunae]|uniref:Uncharacterized protein n=1 Tax=Cupriavidus lacunae TaxID=2666307 RepID=A0A370NRQ5_9BURK|nr:hypothetical protein DN412_21580 [Cupriavidus lacunae]
MLSPHEIAALILIEDSTDLLCLDPMTINALVGHQLVTIENGSSGQGSPRLTHLGLSVLKAVGRRAN